MHSVALLAALLACAASLRCDAQDLPDYAAQLDTRFAKRYVFVELNVNWEDANLWCDFYGMTLAQFASLAEGEEVHAAVQAIRAQSECNAAMTEPDYGIHCRFHQYWIGAFNPTRTQGGSWTWVDGSVVSPDTANWGPGQPDAYPWEEEVEACATAAFYKDTAMWNDQLCSDGLNFICSGMLFALNPHSDDTPALLHSLTQSYAYNVGEQLPPPPPPSAPPVAPDAPLSPLPPARPIQFYQARAPSPPAVPTPSNQSPSAPGPSLPPPIKLDQVSARRPPVAPTPSKQGPPLFERNERYELQQLEAVPRPPAVSNPSNDPPAPSNSPSPSATQPATSFPAAAVAVPVALVAVAGVAAAGWYLMRARAPQPPPLGDILVAPAGVFVDPPPCPSTSAMQSMGGAAGSAISAPAAANQAAVTDELGRVIFYGTKV
jgi:hypothetical protein